MLPTYRSKNSEEQWAHNIRVFTKLILEGKIHSALRFLSVSHGSGILDLDDPIENLTDNNYTVLDALKDKHPKGRNLNAEALITATKEPPWGTQASLKASMAQPFVLLPSVFKAQQDSQELTRRAGGECAQAFTENQLTFARRLQRLHVVSARNMWTRRAYRHFYPVNSSL